MDFRKRAEDVANRSIRSVSAVFCSRKAGDGGFARSTRLDTGRKGTVLFDFFHQFMVAIAGV